MIVRLFCPKCAHEVAAKRLQAASIEVPVPIARLSDNGKYKVTCDKGHTSEITLDNLKFELLFDMGLNALVDGYPREAVSSFAASLERFYEFYWKVAMSHLSVPTAEATAAWGLLSKQSERQLGAYVTANMLLTKTKPALLNPNREVRFRNEVIHSGYVPTQDEAIAFGDSVMGLLNPALEQLRETAPGALSETYARLSPRAENSKAGSADELSGTCNILTVIDVRHPPVGDDSRMGNVAQLLGRILRERQPHGMELLTEEEIRRRFPDLKLPGDR
jgi:hypothetical protein